MFSGRIIIWKKITAGFAAFGFILSFILGIAGGVLIGAVIYRAFLFSALFAGISLLVLKLIDGFIPELLSTDMEDEEVQESDAIAGGSEQDSVETVQASGNNLDITVDDDEEISYSSQSSDYEELESLEDEIDTSAGARQTDAVAQAAQAVSSDDAEEVEELELIEAEEAFTKESESPLEEGSGKLPDIGAYADGFEQPVGAGASIELSSIDGSGSGSTEILGSMHETQDLVKAVQTVLKKDQEG